MRHPYLRVLFETTEQGVGDVNRLEVGTSVLARISLFHLATEGVRDELGAIANAQHGQATYELAQIDLESLRVVNRVGRTAQDDTNDIGVVLGELVVRHNLAKGVELADTTAYELGGLRTEIENNNLLHRIYL